MNSSANVIVKSEGISPRAGAAACLERPVRPALEVNSWNTAPFANIQYRGIDRMRGRRDGLCPAVIALVASTDTAIPFAAVRTPGGELGGLNAAIFTLGQTAGLT